MKRSVLSRVLLGLAAAVLVFRGAFLLYFGPFYHEAEKAFPVPGLRQDIVPQGIESFGDGFLISGYLSRSGRARLYHMDALGGVTSMALYKEDGAVLGNVFGTYLHGLFDTGDLVEKLANWLLTRKGLEPQTAHVESHWEYKQRQYDILAQAVRENLDMEKIYAAMDAYAKED